LKSNRRRGERRRSKEETNEKLKWTPPFLKLLKIAKYSGAYWNYRRIDYLFYFPSDLFSLFPISRHWVRLLSI
jgi:hypothetical protein